MPSKPRDRAGRRPWRRTLRVAVFGVLTGLMGACDGCQGPPDVTGKGMCAKCTRSAECARGLSCVAGVCETAPPSCHVQIGL